MVMKSGCAAAPIWFLLNNEAVGRERQLDEGLEHEPHLQLVEVFLQALSVNNMEKLLQNWDIAELLLLDEHIGTLVRHSIYRIQSFTYL